MLQSTLYPQEIGRYTIIRTIPTGDMSLVYCAYDKVSQRLVALKILPAFLKNDVALIKRFNREVEVFSNLDHPRIVSIYDYGEFQGRPYIVTRWMGGGNLRSYMHSKKKIDLDIILKIVNEIGSALHYIHQKGIIHRDINPNNILFDEEGHVYIADLGLTLEQGAISLTESSTILGTPAYMSPEQAKGQALDQRADVYSFAIVVYELLTGQVPFSGNTPLQIMLQHITQPVPSLLQKNPSLPIHYETVVTKALAKNPSDRYQTMDEFVQAFIDARPSFDTPFVSVSPVTSKKVQLKIDQSQPFLHLYFQKVREQPFLLIGWIILLSILFLNLLTTNRNWLFLLIYSTLFSLAQLVWLRLERATLQHMTRTTSQQTTNLSNTFTSPDTMLKTMETAVYQPLPELLGGGTTARLLALSGAHRGQQISLKQHHLILGRQSGTFKLTEGDVRVSRHHAEIYFKEGEHFIRDLSSSNGTYVNGNRLANTPYNLRDRDEIRVGGVVMLFIEAISEQDLGTQAKQRLQEFDTLWRDLTQSVHHD